MTVDPVALEPSEHPRSKVILDLEAHDDQGHLDVMLSVTLEGDLAEEAAVLDLADDEGQLDIHYVVQVPLDAHRAVLAAKLDALFASPSGQAMRAKALSKLDLSELAPEIIAVAEQGASIYGDLFDLEDLQDHDSADLDRLSLAVGSVMSREQVVVIQSPEPLFPWAFLYTDPDLDRLDLSTLDLSAFLGFRHELQEEVSGVTKRRKLPLKPKLLCAVCPEVDSAGFHQSPAHPFSSFGGEVERVDNRDDLLAALERFDGHCFYFYGHAAHGDHPVATESWLELQSYRLTVQDLKRKRAPKITAPPVLAFLNGCCTGQLERWDTSTMAGYLCQETGHRLCCVVTADEVPAAFAAELAERFWKEFLIDGEGLGSALLKARRDMLTTWNNPLGLLYRLLGRADTIIGS